MRLRTSGLFSCGSKWRLGSWFHISLPTYVIYHLFAQKYISNDTIGVSRLVSRYYLTISKRCHRVENWRGMVQPAGSAWSIHISSLLKIKLTSDDTPPIYSIPHILLLLGDIWKQKQPTLWQLTWNKLKGPTLVFLGVSLQIFTISIPGSPQKKRWDGIYYH